MKNVCLLLALMFITVISKAQKNVILNITHKLGSSAFAFNQTGQNNLSQEFKITRVDYYISGIRIIHDGGVETPVPDKYILAKGSAAIAEPLGAFNVTNVEGIKFSIGVETPVNNADPSLQPAGHPLSFQTPSMHWGWSAGYRFVALEGKAGSGFNTTFELHGLGNDNYFQQTVMVAGVSTGGAISINLDADYTQALKDINVSSGPIAHGINAEDLTVLQNFRTHVFKPASGTTAIEDLNKIDKYIAVFPNPAKDKLTILQLDRSNTVKTVQVTDLMGRVHLVTTLKQHDVLPLASLPRGAYILRFYEGVKSMGSKKIVLQ
ncbi:MbnP family protein [Taibaiella koreensis]|uniref:MbnP family protein n=1 Tax=Taibaiella koreensis TaxID=1268548 RepID=UPI0013C33C5F|nr:MbnP family protein [Taibaiella koreensis]